MQTVVTAERLWDGTSLHHHPLVLIEDGKIESISSHESAQLPAGARVLDFPGATLGPSYFDVHFHGAAGHDVMEATPQALDTIGTFLASRGTSAYLATTVTASLDATLRSLDGLANEIAKLPQPGRARPLGIHLEGPFLSHAKRGVQPQEHLLAPDIAIFDRLIDAAHGHVRLMTLAPELPGAVELTAHATSRGVRVSLGHSNATAAESQAAIAAGAVSATHTFNAMRPLDHREPGILGTVLTNDNLYSELICDGIHTEPEIVRLWWRAKGPDRAILVTDAMAAAGMPDGEYQLGGFPVQLKEGRATARGVLAGSVLTLDRAFINFIKFTGASIEQALRLLSSNPAAMTGLAHRAGTLAPGKSANMVAIDSTGRLVASIVGGHQAN
ncbi:N-acetylglucosamine-6-phosphate deacetylase [Telmatobacter sp. DSM 110680]|uniref:N-acetylglucosamine-6-phosphate deacetylase n=1 Tax=Telmatobacter sp. DSM 110680 TaxID=3036704 RepID=A0AAU7DJQ6_9BACT